MPLSSQILGRLSISSYAESLQKNEGRNWP
jgi:hypothetical protein